MKDDLKNSKDVDNDNEDINKYFEMDCDKSFSSYGNKDNDSRYTFNYEQSIGEENNQTKHNQIDDYINNNINDNLYNNEINNINRNSNLINNPNNNNISNANNNNNSNNYNNMSNISKNFVNNNSLFINNTNNNNNNNSQNKTISNIYNISNDTNIIINNNASNAINVKYYNKNKNKKNEEEIDDLFSNISKNDKNKNKNNTNIINNNLSNNSNKKEKSGETKIVENLSLSSSSNDIQIVSSEDFRKHFQEDRFGPQRKIEVVETKNVTNLPPFSQYHDKMKSKRNISKEYNKCFDAFFIDDKNKNINKNINKVNDKNIGVQQKKYNDNITPNKDQNNKVMNQRKKFSPLPKNKYRNNNIFHKLLINRLEKQILTDIYDEYQNKEDFDETYYHIDNIKNILNQKGVEEGINYLNTIEPMSLREKIIMESTFFFKQIVKEEIEFAENNDGRLILYKQPDYLYNQNTKHNTPLSGRVNQNFGPNKRGRSFKFDQRYMYSNNYNNNDNGNEDFNYSFYHNNFNKNPFMYKSQNTKKNHK